MTERTALSVESLVVSFGTGASAHVAVNKPSFDVDEGQAFGIVGESGCGKSTLLRSVVGLVPTSEGACSLFGSTLSHPITRQQRQLCQMVFQDPYGSLHPMHTVERALKEPLTIHGLDDHTLRIQRALETVGLDPDHQYRFPHQLSGGQRQRVAIARALILEPKILLLDEPTSALDVSVQAEVLNLLNELRRARNLTYVLVSHDLAVVSYLCDRVAVMKDGAFVETLDVGSFSSGMVQHPYSRQLFDASLGASLDVTTN